MILILYKIKFFWYSGEHGNVHQSVQLMYSTGSVTVGHYPDVLSESQISVCRTLGRTHDLARVCGVCSNLRSLFRDQQRKLLCHLV